MPDCAPGICINNDYIDKSKWPSKEKRHWRVESDYPSQADKDDQLDKIKKKADGQRVNTYVANHWTFEYDLAYSGLGNEIIEAIVKVKYAPKNQLDKTKEMKNSWSEYKDDEEKASYIYSYFWGDSTSKAEVAQQLALLLEEKFINDVEEFKTKLPSYLVNAINYVVNR